MSELARLRLRVEGLERERDDALEMAAALARGEIDAVATAGSSTPILLQEAQRQLRTNEEAMRESRDRLEEAQSTAKVGSWTSGLGMEDEIRWTPECNRIFGLPQGTRLRVGEMLARVHPADQERLRRANDEAIEHDVPIDVEHRVERPDRRPCWVRARASVKREPGQPARMVGTVQDVTDRRLAAETLKASEERYRRIVEGMSEGVWMYDSRGTTTFVNAPMAQMLGYSAGEMVGQPIFLLMDDSQRAQAQARVERRQKGSADRYQFRLRRKDGTELWASIQANPLFDADGRFEAGLSIVTDVTPHRLADETRARLAAIVDSSEDAIIGVSLDGIITSWNLGARQLYQYDAAEVLGRSLFVLVPEAIVDQERRILARVAQGEPVSQYETERLRKDGSLVAVAVRSSPIREAGGAVIGVSKIARDLTAQRLTEAALLRTEEQFRQAQKMEAVGRLAGGVAHDFNNLLSVILGYARIAIDDLRAGDPLRDDLMQIERAGDRATELTRQLLAFSRQQILQPRVIDLNHVLGGMEPMLARLLGEDIELTLLVAPDIGRVVADAGQIDQVVMNLAVNARDAMPKGGKLTIETCDIELDATYVEGHLGVAPGHYVMFAMSDTGSGMDAATRARIFEPFFTTKDKSKGTGLGLSTVFGIVHQSGGHVGVYSEPGHGSTFKVYLPRTDRAVDATTAAAPLTMLKGTETILLVEDEGQVRAVAGALLRRGGYHVLEASNGGEALLISRDFPNRIHLLLTDVVMPLMSGPRLVEELAHERPGMKVLFASGYTDDAIVHHGVLEAGVSFIQKPFTLDALLRKVREVLDVSNAG